MIIFTFSILYKNERKFFFEKNFLLAKIKPDIVLKILFLTINNVDTNFQT